MKYLKTVFSALTFLGFVAICYFVLLKATYVKPSYSYFLIISLLVVSLMISYVIANLICIATNVLASKITHQTRVSVTFDNKVFVEGRKYIEKGNAFFAIKYLPNDKKGAILGLMSGGLTCYVLMIIVAMIIRFVSNSPVLNLILVAFDFALFLVFLLNTFPLKLNAPNNGERAFSIIESDEYFADYLEGIRLTKAFSSLPINEISFKIIEENNYESINNQIYAYYQALLLDKDKAKNIITGLFNISSRLLNSQKFLIYVEYLYYVLAIDKDYEKAKKIYESMPGSFKESFKEKKTYQIKRVYVLYQKAINNQDVKVDNIDTLKEELPLALEEVFNKIM